MPGMVIGGISNALFSQRLTKGVGGSPQAEGGLITELPIELINKINFSVWFNDFLNGDDDTGITSTDVGVAAATAVTLQADELGGALLVDAGTTSTTGVQAQWTAAGVTGEHVALNDNAMDGKVFAWGARVKVDTVANGVLVVGLMETDTTAVSTAGAVTVDNGLYFVMADGGALTASAERATAVTNDSVTLPTMANDTYIELGMRCYSADVSSATASQFVEVYVNGIFQERLVDATNGVVPNVGLCPTIAAVNDAANDIDGRVDYFWTAVQR